MQLDWAVGRDPWEQARGSWFKTTVSAGGRSFTFKAVSAGGRIIAYGDGTEEPTPPGADEFYARVSRDAFGHFTKTLDGRTQPWRSSSFVRHCGTAVSHLPRAVIVPLAAATSMVALPGRRRRSAAPTMDPAATYSGSAPARTWPQTR
jgi:hypothetical protein